MSSPKGSLDSSDEFAPPEVGYRRKKTRHNHVSPRIRRHSIGHLRRSEISPCGRINGKVKDAYLVHASPGAFGSGTPEVAWIRDDFPELCEPITAMMGSGMSWSSLYFYSDERWITVDRRRRYLPDVVEIVDKTQLLAPILRVTTCHSRFAIDMGGCGGGVDGI